MCAPGVARDSHGTSVFACVHVDLELRFWEDHAPHVAPFSNDALGADLALQDVVDVSAHRGNLADFRGTLAHLLTPEPLWRLASADEQLVAVEADARHVEA